MLTANQNKIIETADNAKNGKLCGRLCRVASITISHCSKIVLADQSLTQQPQAFRLNRLIVSITDNLTLKANQTVKKNDEKTTYYIQKKEITE
jgi:hypothetical protein